MTKTVIYTRQSLDKDKQKNSTDVQKSECINYALKKGWLVHEHFNEGDKSARTTEIEARTVLQRLLFDASEGNISRLIVYKRDRLARNVEQYLKILNHLQEAKVEIHFAAENEPPIFHGPIGEFLELILAGFAQQEGENIFRRQTEARQYIAGLGGRVAGKPPFGYALWKNLSEKEKRIPANVDLGNEGKQIVKADQAAIIKEVYKQFNILWSKEKKPNDIFQEMREKSNALKNFTPSDFKTFIPRTIYKGLLIQKVGGEIFEYYDENWKIVDEKTWDEANRKLSLLEIKVKDKDSEPYKALLMNKIRCLYCEQQKNNEKDNMKEKVFFVKKTQYYRCTGCKRKINIQIYDQFIIKEMINQLKQMAKIHFNSLMSLIEVRFLGNHLKKEKELQKIVHRLEETIHNQVKSNLTDYEYTTNVSELVVQYKSTHRELLSIQTSIYQFKTAIKEMKSFRSIEELSLDSLTYKQQETLLGTLDEILYSDKESAFQYKDSLAK